MGLMGPRAQALKHMLRDETDRGADLRLCAMFAHDEVIAAGLKVESWGTGAKF